MKNYFYKATGVPNRAIEVYSQNRDGSFNFIGDAYVHTGSYRGDTAIA